MLCDRSIGVEQQCSYFWLAFVSCASRAATSGRRLSRVGRRTLSGGTVSRRDTSQNVYHTSAGQFKDGGNARHWKSFDVVADTSEWQHLERPETSRGVKGKSESKATYGLELLLIMCGARRLVQISLGLCSDWPRWSDCHRLRDCLQASTGNWPIGMCVCVCIDQMTDGLTLMVTNENEGKFLNESKFWMKHWVWF